MDHSSNAILDRTAQAMVLISKFEKKYPRVGANLRMFWGLPEFEKYLNGLMISDRIDRQGFDHDAFKILWELHNIY